MLSAIPVSCPPQWGSHCSQSSCCLQWCPVPHTEVTTQAWTFQQYLTICICCLSLIGWFSPWCRCLCPAYQTHTQNTPSSAFYTCTRPICPPNTWVIIRGWTPVCVSSRACVRVTNVMCIVQCSLQTDPHGDHATVNTSTCFSCSKIPNKIVKLYLKLVV